MLNGSDAKKIGLVDKIISITEMFEILRKNSRNNH
jgi:hypothetical protein